MIATCCRTFAPGCHNQSASLAWCLQSAFTRLNTFSSTAVRLDEPKTPDLIVVPMPKLSHSMTHGTVAKWLKAPGDAVDMYVVIVEVDTDTLTEEAYKVGDFAGLVRMLIESQEEGFMARHLVPVGQKVAVGTPIALVCEEEESVEGLREQVAPVDNTYDSNSGARTLVWQSYLKERKGPPSGACMT